MSDPTLFDHLARNSDPETSRLAAESLDLSLDTKHSAILDWFRLTGPSTDLEAAEAMVRMGLFKREESARRAVRTMREEHHLLVAALDDDGQQIRHRNSTGRWADCWTTR